MKKNVLILKSFPPSIPILLPPTCLMTNYVVMT